MDISLKRNKRAVRSKVFCRLSELDMRNDYFNVEGKKFNKSTRGSILSEITDCHNFSGKLHSTSIYGHDMLTPLAKIHCNRGIERAVESAGLSISPNEYGSNIEICNNFNVTDRTTQILVNFLTKLSLYESSKFDSSRKSMIGSKTEAAIPGFFKSLKENILNSGDSCGNNGSIKDKFNSETKVTDSVKNSPMCIICALFLFLTKDIVKAKLDVYMECMLPKVTYNDRQNYIVKELKANRVEAKKKLKANSVEAKKKLDLTGCTLHYTTHCFNRQENINKLKISELKAESVSKSVYSEITAQKVDYRDSASENRIAISRKENSVEGAVSCFSNLPDGRNLLETVPCLYWKENIAANNTKIANSETETSLAIEHISRFNLSKIIECFKCGKKSTDCDKTQSASELMGVSSGLLIEVDCTNVVENSNVIGSHLTKDNSQVKQRFNRPYVHSTHRRSSNLNEMGVAYPKLDARVKKSSMDSKCSILAKMDFLKQEETKYAEDSTRNEKVVTYPADIERMDKEQLARLIFKFKIEIWSDFCLRFGHSSICCYGAFCKFLDNDKCMHCGFYCFPRNRLEREKHKKDCLAKTRCRTDLDSSKLRNFCATDTKVCQLCKNCVTPIPLFSKRLYGILPNCMHVFCLDCVEKCLVETVVKDPECFFKRAVRCRVCETYSPFYAASFRWIGEGEKEDFFRKFLSRR